MRHLKILCVCFLAVLLFSSLTVFAGVDKDNMRWRSAWTSEWATKNEGPEVEPGILASYRSHPLQSWFDCDGDGNLEFTVLCNNYRTAFIYENEGDDQYVYRWFFNLYSASGGSLLGSDRYAFGIDMDGDGADEYCHINAAPPKGDPNHVPPIKIWKHEAGSAEFLPPADEWTVSWDEVPIGRVDGILWVEYTGGFGDWDRDGKAEFAINYKEDPLYYFAMIEVTPPLTPEQVQFEIEYMIEKNDLEKSKNLNVANINGVDLDNDGYDELWLPNRNNAMQSIHYLDCTGADSYQEYYWGPEDPYVLTPDSVRVGDTYDFIDLDGDGIMELVGIYRCFADAAAQGQDVLWVGKINPMDPANLLSGDNWARIKSAEEMIGTAPGSYTTGSGQFDTGDADGDGYPDIYIGLGETAGSVIVDVEFVGDDWRNPDHYNCYTIITCAVDANLADPTTPVLGGNNQGGLGDGDQDGKPDFIHPNRRDGVNRPNVYLWEYDTETSVAEFVDHVLPTSFELLQNYPNPFNPTTTIAYSLGKLAEVRIDIYNVNGQLIATLVNEKQNAGRYNVTWNGKNVYGDLMTSGIYFYSLSVDSEKSIKKMTLMK